MATWWQKYIGIPFVDRGRSMQGCDCGGLAWLIYKQERGRELDCFSLRYKARNARSVAPLFAAAINTYFEPSFGGIPFNLAVFGNADGDYHVGVFVDARRILHCKDGMHAKVQLLEETETFADYRGAYALR